MSSTAQGRVSAATTTVRILQWNTYHGGYGTDGLYDQDRQISWMTRMAPDLISLNEVTATQAAAYAGKLTAATGITWQSFHVVAQSDGSGNQILSRYPIIRTSVHRMQSNGQYARAVAQATIDTPGGALNFFSVHLEHDDPAIRAAQVAELETFTNGFAEPRIMAGDFNAGPDTPELQRIAAGWVDAWQNAVETNAAEAYAPDNPADRYTRTLRERIDYILVAEQSGLALGIGEKPDTRDLANTRVTRLLQTSDDKGVRPSDHNPFAAAIAFGPAPAHETTPPSVSVLEPLAGDALSGTVTVSAQAFDDTGVMKVQLLVDGVRTGTDRWAPYEFRLDTNTLAMGPHTLEVIASDASGNTSSSGGVQVLVGSGAASTDEIVLYAAEATVAGAWAAAADATAAGGRRLVHPNAGAAKLTKALASPVHYFETTFEAAAGRPYRLWMRLKADRNNYANDSVFVQFDGAVTASGAPAFVIGTTAATEVNLEDCASCGVAGWGWQDNGWGIGVMGPEIRFAAHGTQRIRVQTREDGVSIDQIVLSSGRYLSTAPGPLKNDATILPKTPALAPPPANAPPSVALTAPATGATFTAPAGITITAEAADSDGTVARIEFFAGSTAIGTATASPFTVEWTDVPAGDYLLLARATDDSGASTDSAAVPVAVTAGPLPNQAPTVAIVSPVSGAGFTAPASIAIAVDANDADGTVARVDFYAGTSLIGTTSAAPFTFVWTDVPAGTYSLSARAVDDLGASAGSTASAAATVTILVGAPGAGGTVAEVSVSAPAGPPPIAPATLSLTATASDPDGIARVEFLVDGAVIGEAAASPYSITWADVPAGTYAVTARATDAAGGSTTSAAVTFTVDAAAPAGNLTPSVVLTAPIGGTTFDAPATLVLTAAASDPDDGVARVEFFLGGLSAGAATVAPYTLAVAHVSAGDYVVTAVATDVSGASTTSAPVSIVVVRPPNVAPQVTITGPASGAGFTAPASISLAAAATDADDAVVRVEFFAGTTSIGSATVAPYTATWSDVAAGRYEITAHATDASGATTASAAVTVVVAAPAPPPPAPVVETMDEIVMHAMVQPVIVGGWVMTADATAAAGARLQNPNLNAVKPATALATPGLSFELAFSAQAGKAYRLWVRSKALSDSHTNDSVFVQFDGSVNGAGKPLWRTGTTSAAVVILEECSGCGVKGWGWADNGYGLNTYGPLVYFEKTGPQRIRIQVREDGIGIDQVVLSAVKYKSVSPGAARNDATVLAATPPPGDAPPNVAPVVALTSPAPAGPIAPATLTLQATASDPDGVVAAVEFFAGTTLIGRATASPYTAIWPGVAAGTYALTAVATDNSGASTTSEVVSLTVAAAPPPPPPPVGVVHEVVMYAAADAEVRGGWSVIADATAAGGARLQNPNANAVKLAAALAEPVQSFDLTFFADAGTPYRLWLRGKALGDSYNNDSVFVQFDGSVDPAGAPVWRLGTTSATSIVLEDCNGCGVKGWGWAETGYGVDVMGPVVYFETTGPQRLRIQTREDGLAIDQVVLSAVTYMTLRPGATKYDTFIMPR